MKYEMRFTGSGGQGVILASVIMAEAAVVAGEKAIQSQAYGPEARGGMCKAETIIGTETIWFPKVTAPNFLLALTQAALDAFTSNLADDAIVMADSSLDIPETLDPNRVVQVPILQAAREKVGKLMTANIVAIGAINATLGLFSPDVIAEAVRRHIPAGTEALNEKALEVGESLITPEQAARFKQTLQ